MFGIGEAFLFLLILPFLAVYFVPTIIAAVRRTRNLLGIVLVNVLAGWTFLGWVAALIWSILDTKQEQPGGGSPG